MAKNSRYASTRLATTVNARYFPDENITDAYYLDGRFTGKRETRAADSTNDREDRGFLFSLFSYPTELGERPGDAPFAATVTSLAEALNRSPQPIDSQINDLADLAVEVCGKATLPQPGVRQTYFSGIMVKDGEIAAVTTNSGCAFLYRGDVLYPLTAGEFTLEAIDLNGNPVDHLNDYSAGVAGTIRYSNVAELMQNDCLVLCNKEVLEILGQREILRLLNEADDQEDAAANIITAASAKQPGTPVQLMISFVEYIQTQEKGGRGLFSTGQTPAVETDTFSEPMYREERDAGAAMSAAGAAAAAAGAYQHQAMDRDDHLWQQVNREHQARIDGVEDRAERFADNVEHTVDEMGHEVREQYDRASDQFSGASDDYPAEDQRFETRVYDKGEFYRDPAAEPTYDDMSADGTETYSGPYNPEFGQEYGGSYDPNAAYDPNATYDPNAGYDPQATYDPNVNYDPNAGYDPNVAYNPNADYDPDQTYDPNYDQTYGTAPDYDQTQYDANRYQTGYGEETYGEDDGAYQDPYASPAYGDQTYYNEGDQYPQEYDQNYAYDQDSGYDDNYYDEYQQNDQEEYENRLRIRKIIFYTILGLILLLLGYVVYRLLTPAPGGTGIKDSGGSKKTPQVEDSTPSSSAEEKETPKTTTKQEESKTTTKPDETDADGSKVTEESKPDESKDEDASKKSDGQSESYVVQDGDFLYNIMIDYYGVYDEALAAKLQELNPDAILPDLNIKLGETIILPPLEELQP